MGSTGPGRAIGALKVLEGPYKFLKVLEGPYKF